MAVLDDNAGDAVFGDEADSDDDDCDDGCCDGGGVDEDGSDVDDGGDAGGHLRALSWQFWRPFSLLGPS